MNTENKIELTKYERVWLDVYCAVASVFNTDGDLAVRWADRALERFKTRFPQKDFNQS